MVERGWGQIRRSDETFGEQNLFYEGAIYMKELLEEYGGVIAACLTGLVLIATVIELFGSGGALSELFLVFMKGIGAKGNFQ